MSPRQDEQQLEDVDQLFAPTLALLCVAGLYLLFVWSHACCDEEKRWSSGSNALNQVHCYWFFKTKDPAETMDPDWPLSLHSGRPCLGCGTHCNTLAMWANTVGKEGEKCVWSRCNCWTIGKNCVRSSCQDLGVAPKYTFSSCRIQVTNSGLFCLCRPLNVLIFPTIPLTARWIAPSFALRTIPSHQLPHTKPHLYFQDSSHISLWLS